MDRRRVVVTGLGVVCPVGIGVPEFETSLAVGKSGVGLIEAFDPAPLTCHIAAEVKGFDPGRYFEAREIPRTDRVQQFAFAAAQEAMSDSQLDLASEDRERIAVYVTSGIGGIRTLEEEVTQTVARGSSRLSPFLVTKMIIDATPAYIAQRFRLYGGTSSVVSACASGTQMIGDALEAIRRGDADVIVTGASDAAITMAGVGAFASMRALSTRNGDPDHASRPFDRERDGFVMGEGSGILILEELEHARARGAHIYAEVLSQAVTSDAYHVTAPDPEATQIIRSMRMAIDRAGLTPGEIDYVNAHGTSTPANDKTESKAVGEVFGERFPRIPVSSTKSMIGHLLGAAGAVETIAAILTLKNQVIYPTINYVTSDPECPVDCVPNVARPTAVHHILKTSFGFGGHNVSIVVGQAPD
ncbi:MAG: beta-ketoacyl-ACP synthase II [Caldisericota bacterium]|jgi:3-oxoacyl-[acyl-carrier-protein] synthase II|nr:beta-ketoacyl-ACP synthase II [Caldisericota bacterium]